MAKARTYASQGAANRGRARAVAHMVDDFFEPGAMNPKYEVDPELPDVIVLHDGSGQIWCTDNSWWPMSEVDIFLGDD